MFYGFWNTNSLRVKCECERRGAYLGSSWSSIETDLCLRRPKPSRTTWHDFFAESKTSPPSDFHLHCRSIENQLEIIYSIQSKEIHLTIFRWKRLERPSSAPKNLPYGHIYIRTHLSSVLFRALSFLYLTTFPQTI